MNAVKCECGSYSKVTDSRHHESGIRRRRRCLAPGCGNSWTTFEVLRPSQRIAELSKLSELIERALVLLEKEAKDV